MVTHTINCKQQLIDLSQARVMGIINVTPDSFYDGGKNNSVESALAKAEQMLKEGATFLDVGGYSSRPNAADIPPEQEINRVVPIIEAIIADFPEAKISVDTFRSQVAQKAIEAGACMVNDISAGMADSQMLQTVAKLQVPYCMMHMRGTPQTMNSLTHYDDLLLDIRYYFSERIKVAREAGINDIIIDPGFGFAKTTAQNFKILQQLESFTMFDVPILVGLSRKSMIYKTLDSVAEGALNGTIAMNTIALHKGANIIRVHDVAQAIETVTLVSALNV